MKKRYVMPALGLLRMKTEAYISVIGNHVLPYDPDANVDNSTKARPWHGVMSDEW